MSADHVNEPFTAFSFRVELWLPGASSALCDAAFSSCDGLEMRFDVHSVREGGGGPPRLFTAPAAPGHVTLRRGMTSSFELWEWCTAVARDRGPRADCLVVVLDPGGESERARFRLRGCLPVRLRGPALDASTGAVAIEELELACESLSLEPDAPDPEPAPLVRAEFRELDARFEREINQDRWVSAQVNPQSIDLTYANPEPRAGGPGSATLALELWFDESEVQANGQPLDVGDLTGALAYFITPRAAGHGRELQPPAVRLTWGTFVFDGHVDSLQQSLEFFGPDARPGRVRVCLTMSRPWVRLAASAASSP
ncbi:MAG: phage tail protein [Actinomycetota bacterium]